jgi:hypothetical protein
MKPGDAAGPEPPAGPVSDGAATALGAGAGAPVMALRSDRISGPGVGPPTDGALTESGEPVGLGAAAAGAGGSGGAGAGVPVVAARTAVSGRT